MSTVAATGTTKQVCSAPKRRYRPIIDALFRDGVCLIRCQQSAQKRVRKMVILEKYLFEQERNVFLSSKFLMRITATENTLQFRLHKRVTGDNFIAESLTVFDDRLARIVNGTEKIAEVPHVQGDWE